MLGALIGDKPALFTDDPAEVGAPDFNLGMFAIRKHGWNVQLLQTLYNDTRVLGTPAEKMVGSTKHTATYCDKLFVETCCEMENLYEM